MNSLLRTVRIERVRDKTTQYLFMNLVETRCLNFDFYKNLVCKTLVDDTWSRVSTLISLLLLILFTRTVTLSVCLLR